LNALSCIYYSFSTGLVTGTTYEGGFVGAVTGTTNFHYSFWDSSPSGQPVAGYGYGTPVTNDLTDIGDTSYFYDSGNPPFDGYWDFTNTWEETSTFPTLRNLPSQ